MSDLGPLPEREMIDWDSRTMIPIKGYTADQMRAERARTYALGIEHGRAQAARMIEADAAEIEQLACVRQALPEQWRDSVPSVAVATLTANMELLRAALQEADTIMGHDDVETAWRERWAGLWAKDGL